MGRPVGEEELEETSGGGAQPEPRELDAALVEKGAKEENGEPPPQPRRGALGGLLLSPQSRQEGQLLRFLEEEPES